MDTEIRKQYCKGTEWCLKTRDLWIEASIMKLIACLYKLENLDGSNTVESNPPAEERVTGRLKRRLTPLGVTVTQKLFEVTELHTGETIPWVIASRHGDADRVGRLLTALTTESSISPTDFSMSVHNAIIGNFLIVAGNKKMHSALSSGDSSFSLGLLEAYGLQKATKKHVGYIYYDSLMPKEYNDQLEMTALPKVCIALLLGEGQDKESNIELIYKPEVEKDSDDSDSKNNDILRFINFWKNNESEYKLSIPGGTITLGRHPR